MMRKYVTSLLLIIVPGWAAALGLGSIELHSGLNEPFDARIELISPTADEIQSLQVRLADSEAFERAGVDRAFVLSRLRFKVETNESGPDYIHITTREPVREPFLDFLLEANWSQGRIFREYTVLLDPPLYDPNARRVAPEQQQAPAAAPAEAAGPMPEQQPVEAAAPAPAPAPAAGPGGAAAPAPESTVAPTTAVPTGGGYSGGDYGPIVTGNTLWSIARDIRPDDSVSIQQMMLALQRSNPDAFIDSNINGLKRGYVLHVPDRDEITSLNQQDALAEVRSQYAMWEEAKGGMAAGAGERPAGAAASGTQAGETAAPAQGESELKIVTPEKGAGAGQTETGGASEQLSKKLALASEQLQSLSAENSDLQEQVSESDAIIADLKRLVELKDDELAKLQQQLQNMQAQAAPAAKTEAPVAEKPAQPAKPPVKAAPARPEPAPAPTSLLDQVMATVMQNLTVIAGALGALILAVLALVMIRRRAAARSGEEATEFPEFESSEETEAPAGSEDETEMNLGAEAVVVEEAVGESTLEDHTMLASEIEEEEPVETGEPAETEAPAVEEAESVAEEEPEEEDDDEEDDPLAEVNVFLAYEHFDQAEEFVRDAIKRDPDNLDYHSKLLEVFYASGDKAKYEEAARVLNERVDGAGPHWDMAEVMWQEMSPNRALFEEPAEGEEEEKADTTGGGIVDLTADASGVGEEDAGLDFDLGDLGGDEEQASGSDDEDEDEEVLDITTGYEDTSTLDISTEGTSDEDILDVTAAVGLDTESDSDSEDEDVLDITGVRGSHTGDTVQFQAGGEEESGGDDLLDVTAHADLDDDSIDEDLLDVTTATSAGADSEELLEVGAGEEDSPEEESSEDNSLDFDFTGLGSDADETLEDIDTSDSDTLNIDIGGVDTEASSEPEEKDEEPGEAESRGGADNIIDFDGSGGAGEDEGGIELDLGSDEEKPSGETESAPDSGFDMDISLDDEQSDDEGGISLDMPEDEKGGADDQGADLDFSLDDGDAAAEKGADDDFSIDLEIEEDEPADSSPSLELDSDEDEDDDEGGDVTMFVPRSSDSEEQSAEDEIATKLDLAKAYVELGDKDSAKDILEEIIADGNAEQQQQARELMDQASS